MYKNIQPYKNRLLDLNLPVKIYRNLNKSGVVYSIKQNKLVVGHTSSITLKDCICVVNLTIQQRVIKSNIREVHAYIKGFITNETPEPTYNFTYNPFKYKYFYTMDKCPLPLAIMGGKYMSFTSSGPTVTDPW